MGCFQIIKSMKNNTCHSSICYNLFRATKKLCWASKNHEVLAQHGQLVLKLMLVPVTNSSQGFHMAFKNACQNSNFKKSTHPHLATQQLQIIIPNHSLAYGVKKGNLHLSHLR